MGTNSLSVASPGQDIPADHHNELVTAFLQEIVPRNASRVPTDLAGNLGTSALRFLRVFSANYHVGDAANNLKIYEGATGELWIERNSSSDELIKIKSDGVEILKGGVVVAKFEASTLTTPEKYIDHDSLKTNYQKLISDVQTYGSTGNVNDLIYSETMNNCIAGKRIKWTDVHRIVTSGGGDIEFYINGNQIFEYNEVGSLDTVKVFTYTIPSNGNYTFSVEARDTSSHFHHYRIEEI